LVGTPWEELEEPTGCRGRWIVSVVQERKNEASSVTLLQKNWEWGNLGILMLL
jgi:hypothetical protein